MQSEHCGGVSARGAQLSGLPIHVCRTTMKAPNDLTTHNLPEPKWLRTDFSSGSSLDKPVPAHSNRNQTNSESTPGNPVCTPSESKRTPSIFRATPSTLRLKPSELRVFCGQLRYHSESNQANSEPTPGNSARAPSEHQANSEYTPGRSVRTPVKASGLRVYSGQLRSHSERSQANSGSAPGNSARTPGNQANSEYTPSSSSRPSLPPSTIKKSDLFCYQKPSALRSHTCYAQCPKQIRKAWIHHNTCYNGAPGSTASTANDKKDSSHSSHRHARQQCCSRMVLRGVLLPPLTEGLPYIVPRLEKTLGRYPETTR